MLPCFVWTFFRGAPTLLNRWRALVLKQVRSQKKRIKILFGPQSVVIGLMWFNLFIKKNMLTNPKQILWCDGVVQKPIWGILFYFFSFFCFLQSYIAIEFYRKKVNNIRFKLNKIWTQAQKPSNWCLLSLSNPFILPVVFI